MTVVFDKDLTFRQKIAEYDKESRPSIIIKG